VSQSRLHLIHDRAAYRRWAEAQPRGRFERVGGEVVAMSPERGAHLRIKAAVWLALRQGIAAAKLPCEALPDGATIEIGDDTDYEPDAVVTCGERMADDAVVAPNPVIVVEVLSPSTMSVDTGVKLADYFKVPSIQHYLIVRADRREVVHHRRRDGGSIETQALAEGTIDLSPPGFRITVHDIYRHADR
jgi:Uma2 family endonuclease